MPKVVLKGPAPLMSVLGLGEGRSRVGATVSINGYTWRIPRNEAVDVPGYVVAYMRECRFNVEGVKPVTKSMKKGA